jgi:hypothetical protein
MTLDKTSTAVRQVRRIKAASLRRGRREEVFMWDSLFGKVNV